ncbi:MAG: 4Fe-4S dicluster domain-containing protein [Aquificales bacterium]|nr:4Fe-4S dicluster domain-containing protein [Aquificales bacterium]
MSTHTTPGKYGFLIDVTHCIDCRACNVAYSVENEVSMNSTRIWMNGTGVVGEFPNLQSYTAPFHCMHCTDPSCVSACTVGALTRDHDGIVQYDDDRCIGCRYCIYACPFQVPNIDLNEQLPLIVKCDMCGDRLEEGEQPACAATCPPAPFNLDAARICWQKPTGLLRSILKNISITFMVNMRTAVHLHSTSRLCHLKSLASPFQALPHLLITTGWSRMAHRPFLARRRSASAVFI